MNVLAVCLVLLLAALAFGGWLAYVTTVHNGRILQHLDSLQTTLEAASRVRAATSGDGGGQSAPRIEPPSLEPEQFTLDPALGGRSPLAGQDSSGEVPWGDLQLLDGTHVRVAVDDRRFDPIISGVTRGESWVFHFFYPMLDLLRPRDRVLDLGAHIGTFSLAAAALGCEVVAVEAAPENLSLLNAGVRLNGFERMRVIAAAATDHSGTVEFMSHGPWGTLANPAVAASPELINASHFAPVRVPAVTVDELLAKLGWDAVDVLKMDIEGSEVAALSGMNHLLAAADNLIIFYECNAFALRFFGETAPNLIAGLRAFGFSSYHVVRNEGGPPRLVLVQPNDFEPECVANYVAVKDRHPLLSAWPVRGPFSEEETIARVLHHAQDRDWYNRAHVAEALRNAPTAIVSDGRVVAALDRLASDENDRVRLAVAWFHSELGRE